MKQKTKELVLIKSGDYMLDMSKLVFGGIFLVGVMKIEGINNETLLIVGGIAIAIMVPIGLFLITLSQKNKKKGV